LTPVKDVTLISQQLGDPRDLIKLCVSNESFSLKFIREANKKFRVIMEDILLTCWEACKYDTDVLIENPPCKSRELFRNATNLTLALGFAGLHIAEKLNIPLVVAFTMPWTPSGNFSHVSGSLLSPSELS
jgi:sterol 3beta-glucosyltransferase